MSQEWGNRGLPSFNCGSVTVLEATRSQPFRSGAEGRRTPREPPVFSLQWQAKEAGVSESWMLWRQHRVDALTSRELR